MPMLPSKSQTLRLLVGLSRGANTFNFCIFVIDHQGIKAIENGTLESSVGEHTAMQYCVNTAIRIAGSTCHEYSHVQLFRHQPPLSPSCHLCPNYLLFSG
jgi:hypothetical protein